MSSNPPPTYVVPIYNPAYFASSTEGLTIGEASGIFLNKRSPDIATALETFNAGINTNNITPTTTASSISLNSSKTGSTNADPCIAIATSSGITRTIKIGAEGGTNPNSVHLAGLDITNTGLNNITGTTGVINIGNLQTDGILNLGTNTGRTATGTINIGNTASNTLINIETNSTTNPCINIGTAASTGRIKIARNAGSVDLASVRITNNLIENVSDTAGALALGLAQTSGALYLGGNGGVRTSAGLINIGTKDGNQCPITIHNGNGATNTGSVSIANGTLSATTVAIQSTTGTGVVTIGNSANTTSVLSGIVNINNAGASSAGSVNIANTGANTTAINIGSTTGTGVVNLQSASSVRLNDLKVVGNFLNNSADESAGAIYIASKQTSGVLWIGSGDSARNGSGAINIGTGACPINIMTRAGFGLGGSVNIANGDGASQTTAVNIGSGSTTGVVTIGGANNTVQVNGALTLGTGRNITLQPTASAVIPTSTQLGYAFKSTPVTTSTGITSGMTLFTASISAGSYAVTLYAEVFTATPGILVGGYLSSGSLLNSVGFSSVYGTASEYYSCMSTVFVSSATTISIPVIFNFRSGTITNITHYYSYIKIG